MEDYLAKGQVLAPQDALILWIARVFPVSMGSLDAVELRSLCEHTRWYIPDTTTLGAAFQDKVHLLVFPVKVVRRLSNVFKTLDCEGMFLSAVVEQSVECRGTVIRDLAKEGDLKARISFIAK
jgi:hypothetical protein